MLRFSPELHYLVQMLHFPNTRRVTASLINWAHRPSGRRMLRFSPESRAPALLQASRELLKPGSAPSSDMSGQRGALMALLGARRNSACAIDSC